ncbi:hypothetical protein F5051DRAFT_463408 [Lentinula edodes]|nr:hypothetical protein F5051DRAFT_463408 [Lentinula edodes]
MYNISARLAKALGEEEIEFGGMNMIFAGDFAQLPPAMGSPLYSNTIGLSGNSIYKQEEAIGKAIWHRITTVVILQKNMRQKLITDDDNKFRTALEHMRYKKCTAADIAFLRSRISANISGANSICEKIYRDIPIITAFNVHKDEINRVGCERFAAEHNETLIHFYSEDICRPQVDNPSNESKGAKRQPWKKILPLNEMTDEVQHLLWTLNHSASDSHIPSKLSLCIGMPVMIRRNLATELCMTKGQEGIVYGWQTKRGTRNQMMLDVLFVKLINLPSARVINIDGLPENIVPVYSTSNTMIVTLPNGSALSIMREQVEVLPDFSMTDYASQGKTRPKNVVDVSNCKDYHGIYTALSRGATASGTIILQGFSPKKLTDGKNLDILQEFRRIPPSTHKNIPGLEG